MRILHKIMVLSLFAPGVFAGSLLGHEDFSGSNNMLPPLGSIPPLASELGVASDTFHAMEFARGIGAVLSSSPSALPVGEVPYGGSIFPMGPAQWALRITTEHGDENGFCIGDLALSAAVVGAGSPLPDCASLGLPRSAAAPVPPAVGLIPSAEMLQAGLLWGALPQADSMPRAATNDVGPWNADPTGIAGHYPSPVNFLECRGMPSAPRASAGAFWYPAPACSVSATA